MKYFCFLLFFALSITTTVYAQPPLNINNQVKKTGRAASKALPENALIPVNPTKSTLKKDRCGFALMMQRASQKGYNEAAYEEAFTRLVKKRIASSQTAFTGIVTIPVVFHCIYRNGQSVSNTNPNLTAAKYQAQLDQLNKDYANLSGSAFGVATDVRIRFCLAVVDTAGRPMTEPGIDRINGNSRGWSNTNNLNDDALVEYFESTIKPASVWDPYSYFNIWTAAMNTSGLLGYATFPSLSTLPGLDNTETDLNAGVIINWQAIGSTSSPGQDEDYGFGRTLTHETGHFLGLRHIWGDADCGNDYCADTPPHDDATTGCPTPGVLNNCTPSQARMFQNYMDYSSDACLNTFTADQALRCQAAMDNSPRRFTLIASKACQARAANAVQFAAARALVVSEAGITGQCPATKSYSFNIYVSDKSSAAATLNFYVAGGIATLHKDFTIATPQVTYTANDNAVKTLTITIIDDEVTEGTETIEIGYTISGSGVVPGPEKQTIVLSITDDDAGQTAINTITPVKTLLNENFNASATIPEGWFTEVYDDGTGGYTPNQWVISANGGTGTNGNAAHISRSVDTKINQYSNTAISDAYLFTPLLDGMGVRGITATFKWRCLGEAGYDMGYIGYIPEGQAVTAENVLYFDTAFYGLAAGTSARTATITLPVALSNSKFHLVFNWYNDESAGSNPPFTIDDIVVTGQYFTVAAAAGADTAFVQYAGQTVDYYSRASGSGIIATVSNLNEDVGCIQAAVQQSGTGRKILLSGAGGYYRTDKVISLMPALGNTTAVYQATLYYSTEELSNAWNVAEIPQLKLIKIKEGVDLTTTIAASDIEVTTPVFADKSQQGYYSYTGSFTGFSQFMLGFPTSALPVQYSSFTAMAKGKVIVLSWTTAQELNNKGFWIERSVDAVQFETIAWVQGRGSTMLQSNYTYTDNFVVAGNSYYYRLRQVNTDGGVTLSAVRQVRLTGTGVTVTISPVPARDVLHIWIQGGYNSADMALVNMHGQLVRQVRQVNLQGSQQKVDIKNLPPGIYTLHLAMPGEKLIKKIVIE